MNEKYTEVLQQYEMEVETVRRGRGAWICETDRGCRLLKEYRGTVRRLEFEDAVLSRLDLNGPLRADRYVRSREGGLVTVGGDGTRYVLKEWFVDRECSLQSSGEIRQALLQLANLHRQLRLVPFKEEWRMGSTCDQPPQEELARHNRELQRTRSYIRTKRGKSEFELRVIAGYDAFFEQAREAACGMEALWREQAQEESLWLCHGSLDHHHVLIGNRYTAIIDYNRMHLGVQACDLYRFMRKVMEKHGWDLELGLAMLDSYQRVLPMGRREYGCLYYLFLYPEKYWKQLNYYYNTNKAWIPARSVEKLEGLEKQQPARNLFLERLRRGV